MVAENCQSKNPYFEGRIVLFVIIFSFDLFFVVFVLFFKFQNHHQMANHISTIVTIFLGSHWSGFRCSNRH